MPIGKGKKQVVKDLEKFQRAAEIIAENPRISNRKVMEKLGYADTTVKKGYTKSFSTWVKSKEFKRLVELNQIAELFKDIGQDMAVTIVKPIFHLSVDELIQRLIDPWKRKEIPTRTLMEFVGRYAKLEAELKGQIPPEIKVSLKTIKEEMASRVSPEVKKAFEAEIKKN